MTVLYNSRAFEELYGSAAKRTSYLARTWAVYPFCEIMEQPCQGGDAFPEVNSVSKRKDES
jgi:hypothetical protein